MYTAKILVILMLSAIDSCAQQYNGNRDDIDVILKNTAQFSAYVMASDYQGISNSYTEDAKVFPNKSKILSGGSIMEYWTLPEGVSTPYHKIRQEEITIVGNTAYDYGYYEGKTKHKDGRISSWAGKYVIVWKKVDTDWKMYLDIWNSIPQ